MEKLEIQNRQLESQWTILEAQKEQSHLLEARFARLLEGAPQSKDTTKQLEYHGHGHIGRLLEGKRSLDTSMVPSTGHYVASRNNGQFDDAVIGQIRNWIERCELSHASCMHHTMSSGMPTRLLDIGDEFSDVFLCDSIPSMDATYVALSYMWGGPAPIVTTISSLAARKQSIPWNIMPRVFQDAIQITRKIEIRYLWIDALCIIQDSAEDWEREASLMDIIYGNAAFTICGHSEAADSSNLRLEEVSNAGPRNVDLAHTTLASIDETQSLLNRHGTLSQSAWWTRAWTTQERLLSKRLLHLQGDKLYWECNESITPLGLAPACGNALVLQQPVDGLKVLTSGLHLQCMTTQQSLQVWWRLVEQYSCRGHSQQSDKLIALSGMASKFGGNLGTYIAGLWQDHDLAWNLSWRSRGIGDRYSSYTGPSWSWASISGAILAPRPISCRPAIEVIDSERGQLGVNYFGAVSNAHLSLKGAFVEATVTGFEWADAQCLIHLKRDTLGVTIATDAVEVVRPGTALVLLKILEETNGDITCLVICPIWSDLSETRTWKRVALLSLSKHRGEQRWFNRAREAVFRLI